MKKDNDSTRCERGRYPEHKLYAGNLVPTTFLMVIDSFHIRLALLRSSRIAFSYLLARPEVDVGIVRKAYLPHKRLPLVWPQTDHQTASHQKYSILIRPDSVPDLF